VCEQSGLVSGHPAEVVVEGALAQPDLLGEALDGQNFGALLLENRQTCVQPLLIVGHQASVPNRLVCSWSRETIVMPGRTCHSSCPPILTGEDSAVPK